MEYDKKTDSRKKSDNSYHRNQPQRVSVRVFKCFRCGQEIKDTSSITFETTCIKCGSDIKSCVNCGSFDPSSKFQCMKDVPHNISPKDKRNNCSQFSPKSSIEQRFINIESQHDARKAFDNLFKNI